MEPSKSLHCLVYGVYLVTAKAGATMNGMAVAWITRVSHIPPLVGINIQQSCFTREVIDKNDMFCINILKKGQQDVARVFGCCSGRDQNKFSNVDYYLEENGLPVIKGILGHISCKVNFSKNLGDHRLYVGSILTEKISSSGAQPLIYAHSDYEDLFHDLQAFQGGGG